MIYIFGELNNQIWTGFRGGLLNLEGNPSIRLITDNDQNEAIDQAARRCIPIVFYDPDIRSLKKILDTMNFEDQKIQLILSGVEIKTIYLLMQYLSKKQLSLDISIRTFNTSLFSHLSSFSNINLSLLFSECYKTPMQEIKFRRDRLRGRLKITESDFLIYVRCEEYKHPFFDWLFSTILNMKNLDLGSFRVILHGGGDGFDNLKLFAYKRGAGSQVMFLSDDQLDISFDLHCGADLRVIYDYPVFLKHFHKFNLTNQLILGYESLRFSLGESGFLNFDQFEDEISLTNSGQSLADLFSKYRREGSPEKKIDSAVSEFSLINAEIQDDNEMLKHRLLVARSMILEGRFEESLLRLENLLVIYGEQFSILSELSYLSLSVGSYSEALAFAKKAHALNPIDPGPKLILAKAFFGAGLHQESIDILLEYLESEDYLSKDMEVLFISINRKINSIGDVKRNFQRALSIFPSAKGLQLAEKNSASYM